MATAAHLVVQVNYGLSREETARAIQIELCRMRRAPDFRTNPTPCHCAHVLKEHSNG